MAGRRFRKDTSYVKNPKPEPKKLKPRNEQKQKKRPAYEKEEECVEKQLMGEKPILDEEYQQVLASRKHYEQQYGPLPIPAVKAVEKTTPEPIPDPLDEVDETETRIFKWTPEDMKEGQRISRKKLLLWIRESFDSIGFTLHAHESELIEIFSLELVQLQQQVDISKLRDTFNLNAVELLLAQPKPILAMRQKICTEKKLLEVLERLGSHIAHLRSQEHTGSQKEITQALKVFEGKLKNLVSRIPRLWETGIPYEQRFRARHNLQLAYATVRSTLGIWHPESTALLHRAQAFWCFDEVHITHHPSLTTSPLLKKDTRKKTSNTMEEREGIEPTVSEELTRKFNEMMGDAVLPDNSSVVDFIRNAVRPNITIVKRKEERIIGVEPVINPTNLFIYILYGKLKRMERSFNVLAATKELGDTPIALLQILLCGQKKLYQMTKDLRKFHILLEEAFPDYFGEKALFTCRIQRENFRKAGRKKDYSKLKAA